MQSKLNPAYTQPLHSHTGNGYKLTQFKTGDLSIFSYIVQSQGLAVVIDPTIDTESYRKHLAGSNSVLKFVLMTHYHADFVAGHLQFKVPIVMGETAKAGIHNFEVQEMKCGSTMALGEIRIKAIHTPGHTPESTVFQLIDRDGKEEALFTGDTLFLGEVGRPDLAVSSTMTKEQLAEMLFVSLQKLRNLKPSNLVYPGHGSGSSCGKKIGDGNFCTLQKQVATNYAFQISNKDAFVKAILEGMPAAPIYYFHDAGLNKKGPFHYQEYFATANKPLSVSEFKKLATNSVVIDTRGDAGALTQGYIKGAFLMNQAAAITTWIGTFFKPECRLLIFCDKAKAEEIVQKICRIGYHVEGYNNFSIEEWKAAGGEVSHAAFKSIKELLQDKDAQILDVRKPAEWKESGVAENAICIPWEELETKAHEVPRNKHIYIHCKSGMRARLAHSILARKGINSTVLPVKMEDLAPQGVKWTQHK